MKSLRIQGWKIEMIRKLKIKGSLGHYLNRVLEGQRKWKNRNRNGGVRQNVPEPKGSLRGEGFSNYLMKETKRSQHQGGP